MCLSHFGQARGGDGRVTATRHRFSPVKTRFPSVGYGSRDEGGKGKRRFAI